MKGILINMNIVLYIIVFIMGTVFGSFLTLATYRIPLNQDITHKHSYCPKCKHKLSFFDMIPVLSYIFLGAKCRYCKNKIGPRYFIIEILSGISFVFLALLLKINIYDMTVNNIIEFAIGVLYIIFLFLIGGIDKEHNKIEKKVLIYGIAIASINIIYQYTINKSYNLNRIIIYLIIIGILTIINIKKTKESKRIDYSLDMVILMIIINLFMNEIPTILTIICTLLIIAFTLLLNKIFKKGEKYIKDMPIAFYATISNAIVILIIFFYSIGK